MVITEFSTANGFKFEKLNGLEREIKRKKEREENGNGEMLGGDVREGVEESEDWGEWIESVGKRGRTTREKRGDRGKLKRGRWRGRRREWGEERKENGDRKERVGGI